MSEITRQYCAAAEVAVGLVAAPEAAAAWAGPSALADMTVGALTAHLASQVTVVAAALEADTGGKPVVGLFEHFERAGWVGADIDNEANTVIRGIGQAGAEAGPAAVAAETAEAARALRERLVSVPAGAVGGNPRWPYTVAFDDFLVTRIMEIVVHADDLAVSVGVATPVFDSEVFDTAAWVLTRLAVRRHGQPALVRALARAERAPSDIAAL